MLQMYRLLECVYLLNFGVSINLTFGRLVFSGNHWTAWFRNFQSVFRCSKSCESYGYSLPGSRQFLAPSLIRKAAMTAHKYLLKTLSLEMLNPKRSVTRFSYALKDDWHVFWITMKQEDSIALSSISFVESQRDPEASRNGTTDTVAAVSNAVKVEVDNGEWLIFSADPLINFKYQPVIKMGDLFLNYHNKRLLRSQDLRPSLHSLPLLTMAS